MTDRIFHSREEWQDYKDSLKQAQDSKVFDFVEGGEKIDLFGNEDNGMNLESIIKFYELGGRSENITKNIDVDYRNDSQDVVSGKFLDLINPISGNTVGEELNMNISNFDKDRLLDYVRNDLDPKLKEYRGKTIEFLKSNYSKEEVFSLIEDTPALREGFRFDKQMKQPWAKKGVNNALYFMFEEHINWHSDENTPEKGLGVFPKKGRGSNELIGTVTAPQYGDIYIEDKGYFDPENWGTNK